MRSLRDLHIPNAADLSWGTYLLALEQSLRFLEKDLDQAAAMADFCAGEWCTANKHYLDEIGNALFTIHEPRCSSQQDSDKIKYLKRRLRALYSQSKQQPNMN